jgi:hypothetical protein
MKPNGKIDPTAGWTGEEFPQFQELIALLVGSYRAQAAKKELRATEF